MMSSLNGTFEVISSLMAGGAAGISVDVMLFPLDTIKTRLQSGQGFKAAGGFKGIYSGLAPAALASAPNAAAFFCTYEGVKKVFAKTPSRYEPIVHMSAAAAGEVMACIIRVPVEIIKQRRQAQLFTSVSEVVRYTLKHEGIWGMYRGYFSTVIREIPFSFIQFPLWEFFKKSWASKQGRNIDPWQSSLCGALAGGISATVTTPLDVVKTRVMLANHDSAIAQETILKVLRIIYNENGVNGLFAGVIPRTIWISIGGAIFLGVYDKTKLMLSNQMMDKT